MIEFNYCPGAWLSGYWVMISAYTERNSQRVSRQLSALHVGVL